MTDVVQTIYVVVVDEELQTVYVGKYYPALAPSEKTTNFAEGELFTTYTEAIVRAERIAKALEYEVVPF